jgi:crotonobetainyl-CoA:carnitine CoA-transferase CaiB-like acyl-CoA transferase
MNQLDSEIGAMTQQLGKTELCERLVGARVPCAHVRELSEVIDDLHLHATGMLSWFEHHSQKNAQRVSPGADHDLRTIFARPTRHRGPRRDRVR